MSHCVSPADSNARKMAIMPNTISVQYGFLVHAMLALGASHLGLLKHKDHVNQALNHRVQAIKGLNKYIAEGTLSKADGDAAFATMLALTFQSSYMSDGMTDFFSLVRGCECLSDRILENPADTSNTCRFRYCIESNPRLRSVDL